MTAKTTTDTGHPGLWWQDGDIPDEEPRVRAKYAQDFDDAPKPKAVIPTRAQILARGRR